MWLVAAQWCDEHGRWALQAEDAVEAGDSSSSSSSSVQPTPALSGSSRAAAGQLSRLMAPSLGHGHDAAAAAAQQQQQQRADPAKTPLRCRIRSSLTVHALQPLVSLHHNLVASASERSALLRSMREAAQGLRLAGSKTPLLPVPASMVSSQEDVAWVAWPGRYSMALKCDGTRHLLLRHHGDDDTAVLLNRAGTLYRFPLTSQAARMLPPGAAARWLIAPSTPLRYPHPRFPAQLLCSSGVVQHWCKLNAAGE